MRRSEGDSEASLGDASAAAGHGDPARDPGELNAEPTPGPADVEDIRALLEDLSRLRLTMSADLSAAAGALEAGRRDVAGNMVDSARRELADMRTVALSRGGVVAPPGPESGAAAARRIRRAHRRAGRVLAGAVALALTVVLIPRFLAGPSSEVSAMPTLSDGSSPVISTRLVSDEFEKLRQAVEEPGANPADLLAAGRDWQRSLTSALAMAATQPDQAKTIVLLLRKERALLAGSARLQTPVMLDAVNQLRGNADNMLTQLRSIADTKVLAQLPQSITPVQPSDPGTILADGSRPVTAAPEGAPTPTSAPSTPAPATSTDAAPTTTPAPTVQPTTAPPSTPAPTGSPVDPTASPTDSTPEPTPSTPVPTAEPTSAVPAGPPPGLFPLPSLPPVLDLRGLPGNPGAGNPGAGNAGAGRASSRGSAGDTSPAAAIPSPSP